MVVQPQLMPIELSGSDADLYDVLVLLTPVDLVNHDLAVSCPVSIATNLTHPRSASMGHTAIPGAMISEVFAPLPHRRDVRGYAPPSFDP